LITSTLGFRYRYKGRGLVQSTFPGPRYQHSVRINFVPNWLWSRDGSLVIRTVLYRYQDPSVLWYIKDHSINSIMHCWSIWIKWNWGNEPNLSLDQCLIFCWSFLQIMLTQLLRKVQSNNNTKDNVFCLFQTFNWKSNRKLFNLIL